MAVRRSVAARSDTDAVRPVHVGCSGWNYRDWRERFYPKGLPTSRWLEHYAQHFDTVEVNATFYRLPSRDAVARWAEQTPPEFRFAVKLVGYRVGSLAAFGERVAVLGERLGPIRVSLPNARDGGLVELLLGSLDPQLQLAFDLPHPSWDGIEERLAAAGAARVDDLDADAGFRYVRLREPPYDDGALRRWAQRLRPLLAAGVTVYCYFKHEDEPSAPLYAARLAQLVAG